MSKTETDSCNNKCVLEKSTDAKYMEQVLNAQLRFIKLLARNASEVVRDRSELDRAGNRLPKTDFC
jgi:hypothetical protein